MPFWRWAALAIFVSVGPINILLHGLFGAGSLTTAAMLIGSLAALFLLGDWRSLRLNPYDYCFVTFTACAVLAIAIHPAADAKELTLFAMTLSSYCAGRLFVPQAPHPVFPTVILFISAIGAALMVWAMLNDQVDPIGRPLVLGEFSAAPVQFLVPFMLAAGALLSREKIAIRWFVVALVVVIAAVLSASMVRFAFIAAACACLVLAAASRPPMRRTVILATMGLVVVVVFGQLARPTTATKLRDLTAQAFGLSQPSGGKLPELDECGIDNSNSVAIRKALYRDWSRLIAESPPTGIGLDGFLKRSCRGREQVHNTLLQIALEFGWPAAGIFLFILSAAFVRLFQARSDEGARFGLFALAFLLLMSTSYGRASQDRDMFLFMGYAVALTGRRQANAVPALNPSA
jgi:hypothetical protein